MKDRIVEDLSKLCLTWMSEQQIDIALNCMIGGRNKPDPRRLKVVGFDIASMNKLREVRTNDQRKM